jgi:hypothetical protein
MDLLNSSITTRHYTASTNSAQPLAAAGPSAQRQHSRALSRALLSPNARYALDQTESQPNGHHQLMGVLASNGITDGTLHLVSTQGADASYQQQVSVPPYRPIE